MKVVFLDRDGTIIRDYPDEIWSFIKNPDILEGSISGLKYLQDLGYSFIIITNQYIIEEGYISYEDYHEFNKRLLYALEKEGIKILDVFYCPHKKDGDCNCCKPKTGMMERALAKYPDIDLEQSIFIGDSKADKDLAEKIEIDFYGINLKCENELKNIDDIKKYLKI